MQVHSLKRALYPLKRDLLVSHKFFGARCYHASTFTEKSPIFAQKSPVLTQKSSTGATQVVVGAVLSRNRVKSLCVHIYINTLQHTATHCNTLQHTATHCNTLQHTASHCNTLQHTATMVKFLCIRIYIHMFLGIHDYLHTHTHTQGSWRRRDSRK